MPTSHQVGAKTTQQPPCDVSGDVAPESSAGHTNTTMRSDHITAGTPTGPSAPNSSSSSKGQADSPAPGALHYQGDTTEDEDGSIGDGRPPIKKRPRRTKKVPKRIRRVTASPLPEAPPDSSATTGAGTGTKKRKMQTKKAKRTIGMLLSSSSSSSSDDESSKDEKQITAGDNDDSDVEMEMAIAESLRTHRQQQRKRPQSSRSRSRPGGGSSGGDGGWLKSFHTSIGGPGSVSDGDSSSSSEDDDDDLDHRLAAISRRNWLSSASRDAKLDHMATISSDADKILQMLLWDVGFDYHIYSHQFEAIRFVAGLQPTFPLVRMRKNPKEKTDESDSDSSLDDDDDEDESVRGMLRLDSAGGSARSNALRSAPLLPTRGMLLADEMGLVSRFPAIHNAVLTTPR